MKKAIVVMTLFFVLVCASGVVSSATGPAPNSGDGVSDGSGMDRQPGPAGDNGDSPGPAPNSGDGISDGSGMEPPE